MKCPNLHCSKNRSCISRVPNRTGRRGRVIQVHSHFRTLRTLTGEGIDSNQLRSLHSTFENLFSALIDGGNTDDKVCPLAWRIVLMSSPGGTTGIPTKIDQLQTQMSSQSINRNITHLITRSGTPLTTTVSTYRLVAALVNMSVGNSTWARRQTQQSRGSCEWG